ncbi:DUF1203 domain-containing protein [Caulobacter sp. NIBR1757]|uniref:DUF1203 domain-containing protein n=1 Tax=Caulobacter sp. NIBR1757 TaxID=3016000 RepID=UPI0022F11943|nr:DUF1203 domain-containing protein [Caulobacter sp. NIBR1757]WGM39862.1 hypothetical protein AMEJIAPC_02802 [Caulobacter sp. NIBR1757]
MPFTITGLSPEPFRPLFGLSDAALAEQGVIRVHIDAPASAPCRITLQDAEPGETVLLLNHEHLPVDTPYRSRHAIYVREIAQETAVITDALPLALERRLLAIRAFDGDDMMVEAEVVEGREAAPLIEAWLADEKVAYLHAHYARRGCFAARIDRC